MIGLGRSIALLLTLAVTVLGTASTAHCKTLSGLFQKAGITPSQRPREAYSLALPDLDGNEVRLEDLRGKIVILNIWATWCAPCREEMPSIERLHAHFKGRDLTVLAVSVDMARAELIKAFVEEHNYTFTVLHDPRGNIMKWFGVRLIPVTYIIDKSGKVAGKAVGLRDWNSENMIRLFEELLGDPDDGP